MATSQIATNMSAVRTHNVFAKNNANMATALNRVSTGLKLTSAKDGGAQYAISEKMRERINSNQQASQNVQNDSAMSRTASSGLDTTLSILKTMKARVLDAANDSNTDDDRKRIQTEVNALIEQINDNATSVKYNGKLLLSGDFNGEEVLSSTQAVLFNAEIGTNTSQTFGALGIIDTTSAMSAASGTAKATVSYVKNGSTIQTEVSSFTSATALSIVFAMIADANNATVSGTNATITGTGPLKDKNGDAILAPAAGTVIYGTGSGASNNISNLTIKIEANNPNHGGRKIYTFSQLQEAQDATTTGGAKALAFQVGEESGMSIALSISDMRASALGIGSLSLGSQSTAAASISTIDEAINKVLDQQTSIGAVEQRLGYVADNLDTINENLQAADSALRDADLSQEISNFMKYSVLSQSAQYMLAQSNQNAFQVLNLLQ